MKSLYLIILLINLPIIYCTESNPLEFIDIKEMDDYDFENTIKVDKISNACTWVSTNIEYQHEPKNKNYWQTPEETYNLKTGDCEDLAMLFAYIIWTKLNIKNVYIIRLKIKTEYHIIVEVNSIWWEPIIGYEWKPYRKVGEGYKVIWRAPYVEAIWMTVNYHKRVGQYF